MAIDVTAINALAELERLEIKYEPAGNDEVRIICPAHPDKNPSASLNVKKNVWQCYTAGCKAKGDIISLIALTMKFERPVIIAELSNRYELEEVRTISAEAVERDHGKVFQSGPLLDALYARGVTDEMIRNARLGFSNGRITIPIRNIKGQYINVRRYLPRAPSKQKMKNTQGYGKLALYQPDQADRYDTVWICGGEIKALVVGHYLYPHGVGAISPTGGEGNWELSFNKSIKGKRVYICMDIDEAGVKAAESTARMIAKDVAWVGIVKLPLDRTRYKKGDVNDWIGQEKATVEDLLKLQAETKEYTPTDNSTVPVLTETVETTLHDALRDKRTNSRLRIQGVVSAFFETPYVLPHIVDVYCDKSQKGCAECNVYCKKENERGGVEMVVPLSAPALAGMVEATAKIRGELLRETLGIPTCPSYTAVERQSMTVYDARVSPRLSLTDSTSGAIARYPSLIVNTTVESNIPYEFEGTLLSHPRTGQAVFLFDKATEAQDSLSTFSPTDAELKELEFFSPKVWTEDSIHERLKTLYDDLTCNVTRIFGRHNMHLLFDLVYHSPLLFHLEGSLVKGWINAAVIGDSGQGKTEASSALLAHYGLGERVVCKNASVAGLVGGLQQIGSRWFASFGVIPQQDRRLVILEEAKGITTDEIGKMTDMRSSGVAEIPKIERGKANARTRLLFLSNQRQPRPMAHYSYGIEALVELIGSMEDIRRFDIADVVNKRQVDASLIAESKNITIPHKATSELCRRAILFAWTRDVDQVRFTPEAVSRINAESVRLCAEYTDEIPLLDRGTTHLKIARLAAALAARTYSHDSRDEILVRDCHVGYIVKHLRTIYSDQAMGYLDFSRTKKDAESSEHDEAITANIRNCKYPRDVVLGLSEARDITPEDIQTLYGVDRESSMMIISLYVRKRCLRREGRVYRKTERFVLLLKKLMAERLPAGVESKQGIEEEF